jgi:hypothetical protein
MASITEIKRVKASVEKDLLQLDGVTGVGIGEKITDGKRTGENCIRVYVKKKEPKSKVSKEQMIPDNINGIPTDVVEREFELHPAAVKLEDLQLMVDAGTYDPLTGGISIGPCRAIGGFIFVGTLGLVVEDNNTGDSMMLSNFHVMCVDNTWAVGDTMTQPGRPDGGNCPAGIVGTLTRASLGGQVDCAVATISNRNSNCRIVDIGNVNGTAAAVLGEQVRKRGRTTELTHGFVDDISLTVTVNYGPGIGNVTLANQIGIDVDAAQSTTFGNNGDSGSVVVNSNNEVVGLYFAGNIEVTDAQGNVITPAGVFGVANPIAAVLSALDVRLCTPMTMFETIAETVQETTFRETLVETIPIQEHHLTIWETVMETGPGWEQGGITLNKRFDDVKNPAGFDTLMETIQEHATLQETGGNTIQEGIGEFQPGNPLDLPPFALATPHHASGATRFDMPSSSQQGAEPAPDLDAEIERVSQYLNVLLTRRRIKRE